MKKLNRIIFPLLSIFIFTACTNKPKANTGYIAAKAAKNYYKDLINGRYEKFIYGTLAENKIPESYEKQLIVSLKDFIATQTDQHKGIKSVSINSFNLSKDEKSANVFLLLHYVDKTTEQIYVPMIRLKSKWYMR